MRKTLNVIRSEREGSVPVVRKAVRCHQNHRFFTLCHCPVSRFSHKAFLRPFRMTTDDKRHPEAMSKTIRRHPEAIAKDLLPWGESGKMSSES